MHSIRMVWPRSCMRIVLTLCALTLALTLPLTSYAKITACRGDPIIDLAFMRAASVVDIATDAANVDRIDYIYHLPITSALPVTYDASPLAAKEVVTFVYDLTPGTFRLDTIVRLKPGVARVKVTATTTVTWKVFGNVSMQSASGFSGQTLSVSALP